MVRFTVGLVFAVCLHTASALAMETSHSLASLEKADDAFRHRASETQAREALAIYRALYRENPENPDVGWRLSMACYFVGLRLTPEGDRAPLFLEGRDAGRKAISKNTSCASCHFWTAINMALYGKEIGVLKTLFSLPEIKLHLERASELDPTYANGGAQRLLGAIEENLPGILGGSDERARDFYGKAISIAPDEPLNYLFLARLLMKDGETKKQAIHLAHKGAEIPVRDPSRVESLEAQEELKLLLSSNSSQ